MQVKGRREPSGGDRDLPVGQGQVSGSMSRGAAAGDGDLAAGGEAFIAPGGDARAQAHAGTCTAAAALPRPPSLLCAPFPSNPHRAACCCSGTLARNPPSARVCG